MFEATAAIGVLDVQLVFDRGFDECKASRWLGTAADLHRAMRSVSCVGGTTQIARVLTHTLKEARANKVSALIFVGDAMEEKVDELSRLAGELDILGAPVFVFHEDGDEIAGPCLPPDRQAQRRRLLPVGGRARGWAGGREDE
jgi:hypothetical protein